MIVNNFVFTLRFETCCKGTAARVMMLGSRDYFFRMKQKRRIREVMEELRAQGALDWLIAAGYVNATMRDWLAWYDYLEATQRESGVRGSRDRTLTYFTDLYAVTGGGVLHATH